MDIVTDFINWIQKIRIEDVTNFLTSKEFSSFLFPWKVLAVIMTVVFLYATIFYLTKQKFIMLDMFRRIKDFASFQKNIPSRSFLARAQEISYLLKKEAYRPAVLRSELLFYDLLHNFAKYPGKNLIEIVTGPNAPSIPNTDDMVKLANLAAELKKDKNYSINLTELKDIFDSFEDTLRKMNVIIED